MAEKSAGDTYDWRKCEARLNARVTLVVSGAFGPVMRPVISRVRRPGGRP